jgi:glycosyltransferase involved in cell wall biosynthesis
MITAVGAAAQVYARELDDVDAIVTDLATVAQAVLAAVQRRERGEPFYAMILFEENQLAITYRVAANVCAKEADPDLRAVLLNRLSTGELIVNDGPVRALFPLGTDMSGPAYEFYALADAILVRSYAEYAWVTTLFARRPAPPVVRVLPQRAVPVVERRPPAQPGIVVWAPLRDAAYLSLHGSALADVRGDVTCVVASGSLPGMPAAVLTPGDPRVDEALARATCVVCVEPNDPADAAAFAALGYGVVAPLTSGAHEFVADVQLWNGHFPYHLYTAVVAALGRPARVRERPAPPPRLRVPALPAGLEPPLVSVIVPTFNRRDLLARVLGAVGAQSYPRVEAIVVNDAGEPVGDVVARFPFARLIEHATNQGGHRALETGFAASTGASVMFLPDDDWIYPDHVARLMSALLRAGGPVVHGAALLRYLGRAPDGAETLRGLNATIFSQTLTLPEALVASPVSVNQFIHDRRVFADVGWFINESEVGDNEFHMRLLQRHTPVFVPNATSEFRHHERSSLGKRADLGAALTRVYNEVHPFPGRAFLADMRRRALENIARRVPGEPPFAPTFHIS